MRKACLVVLSVLALAACDEKKSTPAGGTPSATASSSVTAASAAPRAISISAKNG